MYCDPQECLLPTSREDLHRPSDRHNRPSDGSRDHNPRYNDPPGYLFTDCTLFDQCNDFYSSTPSSSDTYVDTDDVWATLTPKHCLPPHLADPPPQPKSLLASETPGLPQLGIDYEEGTFPANFFMNPFSVSFPGDIDIPWDYSLAPSHLPQDDQEDNGTVEGPRQHPQSNVHSHSSGISSGTDPAPTSASIPGHLPPASGGYPDTPAYPRHLAMPTAPRPPKRGSASSSPRLNVSHRTSSPHPNVSRPSTSPLINVTLPSPSPTSTPYDSHAAHQEMISTPGPSSSSATSPSSSKSTTVGGGGGDTATGGGFQFVDASDRKTIVRLRNTMVSRKHRDNKVQRIKELERMLEERDKEIEELRKAVGGQGSSGKGKGRAK